ncbi:MAG: DUF3619 family protein [Burkholderiaceae bacterium]
MNELHTAYAIRKTLDQGSVALPSRVTERLALARRQALAELPAEGVRGFAPATGRPRPTTLRRPETPSLFARFALTAAPIALVVVGLVGIALWKDEQQTQEMAELDAAVILDDVPIAGYADHGFGVFLKNNRQ